MTRSIHEGFLFASKFGGSEITWDRPRDVRCSISVPSGVDSPPGHKNWKWALRSPVKKVVKGISALIFACKPLTFDKKTWKLGSKAEFRYKTVKNIFFQPNFSSTTMDSWEDKSFLTTTGREFL